MADEPPGAVEGFQPQIQRGNGVFVSQRCALVGHGIDGGFGLVERLADIGLDVIGCERRPLDVEIVLEKRVHCES